MKYSGSVIELSEKSAIGLSKLKPEIVKPLLDETKFLDIIDPSFTIRKYCITHNIHSIPLCEYCGAIVGVNRKDHKLGFNRFCSDSCRKQMSKIPLKSLECLQDKNWLYNERITLKKSKDTIAEQLNVSAPTINKWLEFHNIPVVKYNCSNEHVMKFLNDEEWLRKKYINENMSSMDIADEIGSSDSTVLINLHKFGIEISPPNSYERPFSNISNGHSEIIDYLEQLGINFKINNRSLLNGLELDILIEDHKLAIEYGSVYTHKFNPYNNTFSGRKDEKYHVFKTDECEKHGIHLFHIWEYDWKTKKELIKSMIKQKLGICNNKIFARKCVIKEVPIYEKNLFLDNNHLQGRDKSLYKYGLYYNDELVSLLTICKSRYNKNATWEISRFCSKQNVRVIGGFSKLLSHFRKKFDGSIITYADRFYSDGTLYENNGMTYLHTSNVSYRYAEKNSEKTMHRMNFQKKMLLKNGFTDNPSLTEREVMLDNGYNILFDCGHKCFFME
jgi:hypothetical protein